MKFFILLLVTICSSVMAFAQFYVIDNQGDVIFSLSEGLPSYVTFERGQNKSEEIPVDLDLPSGNMWAQCNVGADTPYDFGDFYTHTEGNTYYSLFGSILPINDKYGILWSILATIYMRMVY